MSDTNLENVLRRIKKCLALGASPNENEAAVALRQAQKLMEQYNITQEALDGAEIGQATANCTAWVKVPEWECLLASVLRKAFGCAATLTYGYGTPGWRAGSRLAQMQFIGLKQNAQLAAYAHEVLQRQIVKARTEFLHGMYGTRGEKITAGENFCQGFVIGVERKVIALANSPDIQKAIDKRKAEILGPEPQRHKPTQHETDPEALISGVSAGHQASLHRPMSGGKEVALLGS